MDAIAPASAGASPIGTSRAATASRPRDFGCPATVRGNDGTAAGHRFSNDSAERLRLDRRMHDDVEASHDVRHVVAVAGESNKTPQL